MSGGITPNSDTAFDAVVSIIENAREKTFRAVNKELITMYWDIGEYVSNRVSEGGWGKAVVKEFSGFIQNRYEGITGFSASNIWRMKQFYETYRENEKLATLSRELTWSHNLQILSCKTDAEREFYLTLSVSNRYSFRELKRQMNSSLYERVMLLGTSHTLMPGRRGGLAALRDSYVLEFLNLPENHREKDLRKAIVANLKGFILESCRTIRRQRRVGFSDALEKI